MRIWFIMKPYLYNINPRKNIRQSLVELAIVAYLGDSAPVLTRINMRDQH